MLTTEYVRFKELLVELFKYELAFKLLLVNDFHQKNPYLFQVGNRVSHSSIKFDDEIKDFVVCFRILAKLEYFVLVSRGLAPHFLAR